MPAETAITIATPTMVNEETRISPRAKRGRSSFTHVMNSPGLRVGVGTGVRVGRGAASTDRGEIEGDGDGSAVAAPDPEDGTGEGEGRGEVTAQA